MQHRIVTEYSNELHQLLVSVSKHFYFGSDGNVRYQEKPMDVNIKNCYKSRKEHLVYYILRDHFSGTFTFQIATTKRLVPLADFLHYAWSEDVGEEKFIWGMPDSIFIPQMITMDGLFSGLNNIHVNPLHPPSGFASGIRIIRDIEDSLSFFMNRTVDHRLEGMSKLRFEVYDYLINSSYRDNIFVKWQTNLPSKGHPRIVTPYPDFIRFFSKGDARNSSLVLVGKEQKDKGVQQEKQKLKKKKAAPDYPSFSEEKLSQAQELIYDAWEELNRQKCLALARKALRVSPYCADAYSLLAEKSESMEERQDLYQQGVKAGRIALGDLFFKKHAGHFWGYLETRPYMRALAGLSECLWKNGQRQKAIGNYQKMLQLNPNDNQGIRYILVNCLLAEAMDGEAEKLLSEFQESSCFMLYSQALLSFRNLDRGKSTKYLKQAIASNRYVPDYLLGLKPIPWFLPAGYSWGSEEEAVLYAADAYDVWKNTSGALDWLADEIKNGPMEN